MVVKLICISIVTHILALVAEMGFDSRARRPAVIRGSDSPLDCHSAPFLLQIPSKKKKLNHPKG